MKNNTQFLFKTYSLLISGDILYSKDTITSLVSGFFNDVVSTTDNTIKVILKCKIKEVTPDSNKENIKIISLSKLVPINKDSKDYLISLFNSNLTSRWQQYEDNILDELWLEYIILSEGSAIIPRRKVINYAGNIILEGKTSRIDLPKTMDLSQWADIYHLNYKAYKVFKLGEYIISVKIAKSKGRLKHTIDIKTNAGELLHQVIDTALQPLKLTTPLIGPGLITDNKLEHFQRLFQGQVIEYINGEEASFSRNTALDKGRYIQKIKKAKKHHFNIMTLDLETRTVDGLITPISVAWYDGGNSHCLHILDFEGPSAVADMLNKAIDMLFVKDNNKKSVYIHNLSGFDGIFLLRYLAARVPDNRAINDFNLIRREDNIITLRVVINGVILTFKDSFLLLPNSLAKLAQGFSVTLKSELNHELNNSNEGLVTNKGALMNYNINDCIVLYEILFSFSNEIYSMFSLNITKYATLPSLAFAIFRSNFMKKSNIPITTYSLYSEIISGYTGGHVDMFKPRPEPGQTVDGLDVNSLYPSEMATQLFPVGKAKYFELGPAGKFDLMDPVNYGIYYVSIEAPNSVGDNPLLLTKINGRAVGAIGTWSGWYFSEELKYASSLGYKITVHKGYKYHRDLIFKDYVLTLYDLRNNNRGNSKNLICKLLLNSLYGRFGMSPVLSNYTLVPMDNVKDILSKYDIEDILPLGDKALIITNVIKNDINRKNMLDISLPISFAITAYSRIAIHKVKALCGDGLLYSDTDSVYTTKPLPDIYIDPKKLGALKLEREQLVDAVFLGPKIYALLPEIGANPICKIKGCKVKNVPFNLMIELLNDNTSLKVTQDKWFKDISLANISIKDTLYTLKATANKRHLIYKDGVLVGTKPFSLKDGALLP